MPIIDALVTPPTRAFLDAMKVPMLGDFMGTLSEEAFVESMTDHGVDQCVIIASRTPGPSGRRVPLDLVDGMLERWPGRFIGVAGVDVHEPESLEADIRRAAATGYRAVHVYPHHMQAPPNRPEYDLVYALARELDLAVMLQCGFSSRPNPPPLPEGVAGTGMIRLIQSGDIDTLRPRLGYWDHPAFLDDVCRRFPEVRVVGAHLGWPWTEDLIWLCRQHPNLYIATSLFPPRVWPPALMDFIGSDGGGRVLWATNYPEVAWDSLQEVRGVGFSHEALALLTGGAAATVFRL